MINYQKRIPFPKLDRESVNILGEIEKSKFPKGFLEFINYSLSELFANIKEHSQAKIISVKININKTKCLIEIKDNGIGFKKSYLLRKIYPKDDSAAIEFALSGLSTKDFQERGFGLYSIKKLIKALKGEMIVKSDFIRAIIKGNKVIFEKESDKDSGVKIILKSPVKPLDFYRAVE